MPTHTSIASSPFPSAVLARTLCNLDGYLAASNHAADHPWRIEIASAFAMPASATGVANDRIIVIDCPYSKVHVERKGLDDQAMMRSAQLRGVLFGMHTADVADEMLALAYELSADLAEEIHAKNFNTIRANQLPMLLLAMQDEDGPGDMLWLCQQFADELRALLTALVVQQSAEVAA